MKRLIRPAVAAAIALSLSPVFGAPAPNKEGAKKNQSAQKGVSPAQAGEKAEKEENPVIRSHKGTFQGKLVNYESKTGMLPVRRGEATAKIFYTAYTKKGVEDPSTRPLVFCFNGGPGSSSVWLHVGGFGPKRVQMTEDGMLPPPPFRLGANPHSILAVADLVFVDPVSTGFSRADKKEKAKEFHGMEGDLVSVADFVRIYTTRNERWSSPIFLAGESYGAFRVAGLAEKLHSSYGMYANGIILVSGVLAMDTLWGSDLAHVCFLPALSEVAAYHDQLDDTLWADETERRTAVSAFSRGAYAAALHEGLALSEAEQAEIANQMSAFIGISPAIIADRNLRVNPGFFREELLRDEGLAIGRFDARVKLDDGYAGGSMPELDPSYSTVLGPFASTFKDYMRRELGWKSDETYEILTSDVRPWDYGKSFEGRPVSVARQFSNVMTANPHLRVMVNAGWQDLATPYWSIAHTLRHLQIPRAQFSRIEETFYEGGHMMYTIEKSNQEWNEDVAKFILSASGLE